MNALELITLLDNLQMTNGWTDLWVAKNIGCARQSISTMRKRRVVSLPYACKIIKFLKSKNVVIDSFEFKGRVYDCSKI